MSNDTALPPSPPGFGVTSQTPSLNEDEKSRLATIEGQIQTDLKTCRAAWQRIGQNLTEIRDARLYRDSHTTFEDYVKERFDFSRQRAYQLMDGQAALKALPDTISQISVETETLSTTVDKNVSERAARELTKVPEPQRADVARKALQSSGGKNLTAAAIRKAAAPEPTESPEIHNPANSADQPESCNMPENPEPAKGPQSQPQPRKMQQSQKPKAGASTPDAPDLSTLRQRMHDDIEALWQANKYTWTAYVTIQPKDLIAKVHAQIDATFGNLERR